MKTLSLSILALALSAPLALAQTSDGMDHSQMQMSDAQMEGAVHTTATLNSIGDGTVNVSHDPIPEIGWPAMTMDFALTSEAQMLGGASAGDKVTLMLIKGEDGMYAIGAMMPE
ncbi:cation transporter [Pelagivirga sediminicola]|uniref:Cation transporter n=1 Tax=Pelagivirga sediminicola TaxID=2170575 RepID=A0A2T7G3E7_9RHOB|nr:copper-binding protein [Pelagivirga sediminicola]PVA08947.1 cation transporter [Pelagivirga sediminicola]